MGKQHSGLRAYTADALIGVRPPRNGIVEPGGAVMVRGHFCDVGLSHEVVANEAKRELFSDGARWVKVLRVLRNHEAEIASEELLVSMLAAMRA